MKRANHQYNFWLRCSALHLLMLTVLLGVAPALAHGQAVANSQAVATKAAVPKVAFEKIKLKNAKGKTAFSLKPQPDGAKLVDGKEKEVARYKLSPGKLKIKDANDKTLAYIIMAHPHLHIEDAKQEERLWKLQRQSDGDWKLERRNDTLVYRIKKRSYGFEIETPKKQSLHKVKFKSGKTSLRDAKDQTVLSTKNKIDPLALSCLGLEAVKDQRIRFGLAVAMLVQQGK